MKVLADTTVFIDYLRGEKKAYDFLTDTSYTIYYSTITKMEVIQGVHKKHMIRQIDEFFQNFQECTLTPRISSKSVELLQSYVLTNGLRIPDAFIAATAVVKKLTFITSNTKHFVHMKELTCIDWKDIKSQKNVL